MAVSDWFSRQFGERSRFAITVSLGEPGHGKSHSAWGAIALWLNERCLTRAVDTDGIVHDAVRWDLLEIFLWLRKSAARLVNEEPFPALAASEAYDDVRIRDACDWYDLTDDPPTTLSEQEEDDWFLARSEWRGHHALRRAVEGVALPNVYVKRLGDFVEVSWDNVTWETPRPGLRFIEQRGMDLISARLFSKVVQETLHTVASALKDRNPMDADALASITGVNSCAVAPEDWKWLVHSPTAETIQRDLPGIAEMLKRHVVERSEVAYIPHCAETLILRHARLVDPGEIEALLDAAQVTSQHRMSNALLQLVNRRIPSTSKPWDEGYAKALEVRDALGWGNNPMPNPETWLREQHVALRKVLLPSEVALVSTVTPDERAAVTINPASNSRRRRETAYGTALAHLLMDVDRVAVDGAWEYWPSAARARAFAIMLQLPDDGVREILPGRTVKDAADVRRVMLHFSSGPIVTARHLRNRKFIASDDKRDDIIRELLVSGSH